MQNNNFNPELPNNTQKTLDDKQKRRDARNKAEKDNQFYSELEQQRLEGGSYYNTHKPLFRILKFLQLPANLLSMFFAVFGISAIVTWFVTSNTYLAFGIGAIIAIGMQYVNSSAIETWARTYFNADNPKEWARIPLVLAIFTLSITLFLGITGVMYSEEFNAKIVQRISNNEDIAPPTLNTADLDAKISAQDQTIGKIEAEQKEYKTLNKGKSAAWLKADDLAKAKTEREKLIEQRTELLRGSKATAQQTAANSLGSTLLSLILLLVVVCEVFVAITRIYPYYFKREVLEFDGDRINVKIEGLSTRKNIVYSTLSNEEWARQEAIAATAEQERQNEYRRAAAERERQKQLAAAAPDDEARKEIAALRDALRSLQEQQRTITPPPHTPEPPTPPPSNGKTEMGYKRAAILDTDEDSSHSSHSSHKVETVATVATEYAEMDSESLLDSFRSLMSRKKSWERRDTVTAKHNVARCEIRTEAIQSVLKGRGEVIELVDRAYKIIKK